MNCAYSHLEEKESVAHTVYAGRILTRQQVRRCPNLLEGFVRDEGKQDTRSQAIQVPSRKGLVPDEHHPHA